MEYHFRQMEIALLIGTAQNHLQLFNKDRMKYAEKAKKGQCHVRLMQN